MSKYAQGFFTPLNPEKYAGNGKIRYRSSWELVFMRFCDSNEKVIKWASESIQIPYRNPLSGKQTIYVPDFFVVYQDKNGKVISELIEIKPKAQTMITEKTRSARDRAAIAVNTYKWQAANAWAKRMGVTFRVITEDQIFYSGRR